MAYRLGVDVGGTFTDLLLMNEDTGDTYEAKVHSTPEDSSVGVFMGIERVCANAGVNPSEIDQIMHGTTVATNAILQSQGAKMGLVTTKGYRQVLQIERAFVPGGLAAFIVWNMPDPLVDLELTVEADERVGARGEVVSPLDENGVRKELNYLKDKGIESLTVSLINSYANGGHERRIREIASEVMPGVPVSISSEILPEMYEFERTLTTAANAYVAPVITSYLDRIQEDLGNRGINANLHILRSDGGLASVDMVHNAPVNVLMSGPAGGVAGAVWIAEQAGYKNLLTFDMGGTSTDVSLIENGVPLVRRETRVGDVTIRASSLDVRSVGAGGGSIAHVPELTRALRVGPQSAGATPGPAAYGRGGENPTVTDANVVLGRLPTVLADQTQLDKSLAEKAVQTVADGLGLDLKRGAEGIIDIVNENMYGAMRLVSVEQGYDPRDFALIAFGGAGPLHANAIGKLTQSWPVIIPPSPGVLCAYGDATTRLQERGVPDLDPEIFRDHERGDRGDSHRACRAGRRSARCGECASLGPDDPVPVGLPISRSGLCAHHRSRHGRIERRWSGYGRPQVRRHPYPDVHLCPGGRARSGQPPGNRPREGYNSQGPCCRERRRRCLRRESRRHLNVRGRSRTRGRGLRSFEAIGR